MTIKSGWREFRFMRDGSKDLVWKIIQDGDSYHTMHGQLDGAMQENFDRPGPKGKENTKAYVDAIDNCNFHVEREIRKKKESGYIEYINGIPIDHQITKMSFDEVIPKNFVVYKPNTSIKEELRIKLDVNGSARYTRKYNGHCHIAVHHTWGWEIYSRRMDLATAKFPKQIEELEKIIQYGPGTMLVGELLCVNNVFKDDLKSTSRICRSKKDESLKLRSSGEIKEPWLIIYDIIFYNGKDLKNTAYDDRSKYWDFLPMFGSSTNSNRLIYRPEIFANANIDWNPNEWEKICKDKGWEGFVVNDAKSVPGEKFYNFSGKPQRPIGSHKLKPTYEEDVVVYAGLIGTGKRLEYAGSVFVKQLHPDTGEWFDCGKVGSGLDDESVIEVTERLKEYDLPILSSMKESKTLDFKNLTGFTVEIKYYERQPGTNKFQHPVFLRFRDDKLPDECEAQRLAEE